MVGLQFVPCCSSSAAQTGKRLRAQRTVGAASARTYESPSTHERELDTQNEKESNICRAGKNCTTQLSTVATVFGEHIITFTLCACCRRLTVCGGGSLTVAATRISEIVLWHPHSIYTNMIM